MAFTASEEHLAGNGSRSESSLESGDNDLLVERPEYVDLAAGVEGKSRLVLTTIRSAGADIARLALQLLFVEVDNRHADLFRSIRNETRSVRASRAAFPEESRSSLKSSAAKTDRV